ncbi:MAG: radical SAM/Cys-rich protein [Verrucomicrobiales bacterium]|jgi:radical SAM/Cys-rich protein
MPESLAPPIRPFARTLADQGLDLKRGETTILQLNLGKLCNITCTHCHVNAGPGRKEIITRETVDRVLAWFEKHRPTTVDLTGGAPEMAPDFRHLVMSIREMAPQTQIIDRCNLVILNEPGFEWAGEFLQDQRVEIVASMPCYSAENVNAQRGDGVFDRSIAALKQLNALGYGKGDASYPLNLVYNPGGDWLPPEQEALQADYKRELKKHFGITFDQLYALTNLPVSRFASYLRREGSYDTYMELLANAFNPHTVAGLMCRDTISVSWKGEVYDCDFNQMLNLQWQDDTGTGQFLWDVDPSKMEGRAIATANHCYGCTAGAGSSCGGTVI